MSAETSDGRRIRLNLALEDLLTLRMAVTFQLLAEEREAATLARLEVVSPETNARIARLTRALEQLEEIT